MLYYVENLNQRKLGKFLWNTYIIEVFPDGDGLGFIYNKWNPFAYVSFLFSAILCCVMGGLPGLKEKWKHNKLGLDYSDFWKKNKDKIFLIPRNIKQLTNEERK